MKIMNEPESHPALLKTQGTERKPTPMIEFMEK